MKNNKEITNRDLAESIEDLARMTQKGFVEMKEYIDKRFETVDKRFETVDKRFEKIEKKLNKMDDKLDKKANDVDVFSLRHRVEDLELKASWGK